MYTPLYFNVFIVARVLLPLKKAFRYPGQAPILWTVKKHPKTQTDVGTLPASVCLVFSAVV